MIIEGVLRYRGSSMDLLSPLYFRTTEELKDMLYSENLRLYGYRFENYKLPVLTVINLESRELIDKLVFRKPDEYSIELVEESIGTLAEQEEFWDNVLVDNPDIPPSEMWINSTTTVSSNHLRARYISAYDDASTIYRSLEKDRNLIPVIDGADILIKDYKRNLNTESCIAFCNGMFCKAYKQYDDERGDHLRIENCSKFYRNQHDVNRGTVLVDFGKDAAVSFLPVFRDEGKLFCSLPEGHYRAYSYLVCIDNKLYLPDEFFVMERSNKLEIAFRTSMDPAWAIDTKVAMNEFNAGTRNITVKNESIFDRWTSDTARVVAIRKRNLKLIRHKSMNFPDDTAMAALNQTSLNSTHRIMFDGCARGLLFDKSTRAVHEYFVEYANQSFPLKNKEKMGRWDRAIAWVNHCTPIEIWGATHNHMSAHASMHDCRKISGSSTMLWPRFEMLDFIFEN